MLAALRIGIAFRLALVVAIMSAACFAVPPAALAFGHGEATVHCLSHADAPGHDNGGMHKDHGDHVPASAHKGNCCGLFCMSALAAGEALFVPMLPAAEPFLSYDTNLAGVLGERLDRPPISSLSV
jgi:hypothetical protein